MLKIAIFFGLFLAFMLYRVIVNYQGREVTAPSWANVKDDDNVVYDPNMFWHPLNHYND
ncbi:hypothetical protein [Rheinheimera sp. WS51]|uniref:hypothetical protein n=1 Tax=Rheinheimera sp. WS51 TaxID=3425886 RepID=UPI003D926C74